MLFPGQWAIKRKRLILKLQAGNSADEVSIEGRSQTQEQEEQVGEAPEYMLLAYIRMKILKLILAWIGIQWSC